MSFSADMHVGPQPQRLDVPLVAHATSRQDGLLFMAGGRAQVVDRLAESPGARWTKSPHRGRTLWKENSMGTFDEVKGKAEKAAADHPEQTEKVTDQAVQKGGDAADQAIGGKHSQQVDSAQEKADDAIGS
jgi:hypothetical protein